MRRSGIPIASLLLVVLAATGAPAGAELASMVADLNVRSGPNPGSDPGPFVRLGPRVVFFAYGSGSFDRLPWATDGSAAGTRRLPGAPLVQEIGRLGDALLWFGSGSLWRTGGTPASTAALVEQGVASYDEDDYLWARAGGRIYFFRLGGSGWQLWATDGTAAGTRAVASLRAAERGARIVAHGGQVFFVTGRRAGGFPGHAPLTDFKLWRSDGTAAGTRPLRALPGTGEMRSTRGGVLLFVGDELWVSDGTRGGTRPLFGASGGPRFGPGRLLLADSLGGRVFFFDAAEPGTLWTSDGTRRGTRPIVSGLTRVHPATVVLDARLYFIAGDGERLSLWRSHGTAATTEPVAEVCTGACSFGFDASRRWLAAAGGRLVLVVDDGVHGPEPWVSDGSVAGTRQLRDVCPGPCGSPSPLATAAGEVFFFAREPSHGRELWASDGTEAGTRRVTAVLPESQFEFELEPPQAALLGDRVVTAGWDPRGGFEPWTFDRTGRGGAPLGDLATGGEPGADPSELAALGGRVLFFACDGERFGFFSSGGSAETTVELLALPEPGCFSFRLPDPFGRPLISVAGGRGYLRLGDLWTTDGTPGGTVRLTGFGTASERNRVSTAVIEVGGRAVFGVGFGTASSLQSTALWVTDGTAAGTHSLGLPPFSSFLLLPAAVGGRLYFWAADGGGGPGVWTLDSALTAVTRLSDHSEFRFPRLLAPGFVGAGDRVFFLVEVEILEGDVAHRENRLWRSDGTPEGTVELPAPIVGGSAGVAQLPTAIAAVGETLLLFTDAPNAPITLLWADDGTTQTPFTIAIFGGPAVVQEILPRGDEVLFLLDVQVGGATRRNLYRTDGTAVGTLRAVDLTVAGAPAARGITAAGGRLFFSGGSAAVGGELWTSEGSQTTTRRLQEIAPAAAGSGPEGFTVAGSHLFFTADDGLHGRELWNLSLDDLEAPCRPSATALCLGDGRFRAELFRQDRRGERGAGRAVAWSSAAGAFWFYDFANPEAVVKVVDGGAVNGSFWLFYGPLTDAEIALTVTDLESGDSRRYPQHPGALGPFADLAAFPSPQPAGSAAGAGEPDAPPPAAVFGPADAISAPLGAPCLPATHRVCLHGGRFAVELHWRDPEGIERPARAFAHGDRAGFFSFYGQRDLQAALKIVDARPIGGGFWLFATALTHLEYTLTVTDSETGTVHSFPKPAGELSRLIDLTSLR